MTSICVISYGCSANTADAEIIKGILKEKGFKNSVSPESSDLNIILTCIVKTPTERKMTKKIKELVKSGKPLIVAGCMPKAMKSQVIRIAPTASVVGPDDVLSMPEAVEKTLDGERVDFTDGSPADRTCLPRVRENNLIHIQPICTGCLGDCNYCIVKYARGKLHSFPPEKIVNDVQSAIKEGCREVWATGEDTAAYNHEGLRLPRLLEMITTLPGDFRVRVGMMTPNQLEPISDDLIRVYKSEKIYKFLHLPVQSGNDKVLRDMNRRYTVKDFKSLVKKFRDVFPRLGISTDIICGFPGETAEEFNDSLTLISWLRPDVLNISRFWPRPGTKAAKLPGMLHGRETKKRSRLLTSLWRELSVDVGEKWVGWEGEILLDEQGWGETLVGRNYAYKPVGVRASTMLGEFIKVRVTGAGAGFLEASIV